MPLARYDKNGAACSATSLSSPSLITLITSRRRMIIFWPKNETSPLLSLNRTWLTEPTSRRRSHAFGLPFGLVCICRHLLQTICQKLDRLADLVSKRRIRIIHDED